MHPYPNTHIISFDHADLRGGQVDPESVLPVRQKLEGDGIKAAAINQHQSEKTSSVLKCRLCPILTRGKSSGSIHTMLRPGLSVLSSATCFRMSRNSKPSEDNR